MEKELLFFGLFCFMLAARTLFTGSTLISEVGANDYLVKPVDKTELFARIDTHLSLRHAVQDAIENARLAHIDHLTGLYNRRFFMDFGRREFEKARRKKSQMSTIMLDIDNFKLINDSHGHDVGDRLLKQVSSLIEDNTRGTDICGRFGGDEFMMILSGTGLEGAVFVAEKIRSLAEKDLVLTEDNKRVRFTLKVSLFS